MENETYYIVVDPKKISSITKYFRDGGYRYHVECWTSCPIPFDDEDDEVLEFHVVFSCNDKQYGTIQNDLKRMIYVYFGKE